MAITTAIQKGNNVYVYDGNRQLFLRAGTLYGYTATTVSVSRGNIIYTFNEKGSQISSKPAR